MYFVSHNPVLIVVKAGSYAIQVLHRTQKYLEDEAAMDQLPREEQKRAWSAHRAWVALDLLNRDLTAPEAYSTLARLALPLGDNNCAALYLPRENMMLPNDGTAEEGLRMLMNKELPL
jgi:hypothetical protein